MRKLLVLALVATSAYGLSAGELYSNRGVHRRVAALNPTTVSDSGVNAPSGGRWSEVENDAGNTTESNTNAGSNGAWFVGTTSPKYRFADDFTVTGGAWVLEKVRVYAYQTGSTSVPFNGANVRIWNGRPGDGGSTMLYDGFNSTANDGSGTTTTTITDLLTVSPGGTQANVFRCFNTLVPAPGTVPGTTRKIWQLEIPLSTPLTLPSGTYWVDYQIKTLTGAAGAFCPSVTIDEARSAPGMNARQQTSVDQNVPTWIDVIDSGNPATAPDVPQDMPFILVGKWIVYPDAYALTEGEDGSGGLSDLTASDDSYLMVFNDSASLGMGIEFTAPAPLTTAISQLDIKAEYSVGRGGLIFRLKAFNYATGTFQNFYGAVGSTTDTTVTQSYTSTATDYVSGGTLRVRAESTPVNDEQPAVDGWPHNFDLVSWTITE
ncbi:MAG: hypothetical protein U0S12_07085 [Fimbriimonadales bacterium]